MLCHLSLDFEKSCRSTDIAICQSMEHRWPGSGPGHGRSPVQVKVCRPEPTVQAWGTFSVNVWTSRRDSCIPTTWNWFPSFQQIRGLAINSQKSGASRKSCCPCLVNYSVYLGDAVKHDHLRASSMVPPQHIVSIALFLQVQIHQEFSVWEENVLNDHHRLNTRFNEGVGS